MSVSVSQERNDPHSFSEREARTDMAMLSFLFHLPLLLFFWLSPPFSEWDLQVGSRVALIVTLVLYLNVSLLFRERFWSVPSLTFLILSLFHVGLFVGPALNGETPDLVVEAGFGGQWFRSEVTPIALNFALFGLIAYSAGITLSVVMWRGSGDPGKNILQFDEIGKLRERFSVVGLFLLSFSIIAWFAFSVLYAGFSFLLMSYMEYLYATSAANILNYVNVGISFGLLFSVFSLDRKKLVFAGSIYSVFALCALILGMRDNALIPLVCALAIWARLNGRGKSLPLIGGVIGVLGIMSVVRVVRSTGLGNLSLSEIDFSPVESIEEMGSSLRVLHTTITWHHVYGEPYYLGATYLAPLTRQIDKFLGGIELSNGLDYRLMGAEIGARVGSIGGSMIAEAHHNFGPAGIIAILFLFGMGIGFATLKTRHVVGAAFLGVVMTLFLMHVRNSFTPIPFWFLVGTVIIFAVIKYNGSSRFRVR